MTNTALRRQRDGPQGWDEPEWRALAEAIPHIVWVMASDGALRFLNQRGHDYAGAGADHAAMTIHPDDRAESIERWQTASRSKAIFEADYRVLRADGEYRWHTSRAQPILDDGERVVSWYGTSTDIHERKQLERELAVAHRERAEAVTLMATLQEAAPVGFGFVDCQLVLVHMNAELARFVGSPASEQVGRAVPELVPESWGQLEPIYRRVLEGGESVVSVPVPRPDSGHAPDHAWVASFYPVRIDDEVVGVGLVVVDTTERLVAEGFRSTVMSQVAEGVYTLDCDGVLTYMNRAASRMLGWSEEELRGRRMHEVVHYQRADGSRISADECALVVEGTQRRLVRSDGDVFTRKDGTTFPVMISSAPLLVGARVEGVSVVFRDVGDPAAATNLIRVLVADAEEASSQTLRSMLTRHEGIEVVAVATTATQAITLAQDLRPDVVLVDSCLPPLGGLPTITRIADASPDTAILLLEDDPSDGVAVGTIAAGGVGVVDRRRVWVDLPAAVRAAHQGDATLSQRQLRQVVHNVRQSRRPGRAQDLTRRERDVLGCLVEGLSNHQTADRLAVTVNTVRNHVQRVLYKLDVHSRLEAVAMTARDGILDDAVDALTPSREPTVSVTTLRSAGHTSGSS